jgi:hypothetical protein
MAEASKWAAVSVGLHPSEPSSAIDLTAKWNAINGRERVRRELSWWVAIATEQDCCAGTLDTDSLNQRQTISNRCVL